MPRRKPWYRTFFERDFYDYFYVGGPRGIFTQEEEAQRNEQQVDFIVRALELPEGARVLDLGCGWGRHAVRLAQRGYRVTGLDLSVYHLRLARAAARRAGVQVEWLHGDMREIPGRRRYDAVINMLTTLWLLRGRSGGSARAGRCGAGAAAGRPLLHRYDEPRLVDPQVSGERLG